MKSMSTHSYSSHVILNDILSIFQKNHKMFYSQLLLLSNQGLQDLLSKSLLCERLIQTIASNLSDMDGLFVLIDSHTMDLFFILLLLPLNNCQMSVHIVIITLYLLYTLKSRVLRKSNFPFFQRKLVLAILLIHLHIIENCFLV